MSVFPAAARIVWQRLRSGRRLNFRWSLAVWILAVAVPGFVISLVASTWNVEHLVRHDAFDRAAWTVLQSVGIFQSWEEHYVRSLKKHAQLLQFGNSDAALRESLLRALMFEDPYITIAFLCDRKGRVIAEEQRKSNAPPCLRIDEIEHLLAGPALNGFVRPQVIACKESKGLQVGYAVPSYASEKEINGVIGIVVRPDDLNQRIQPANKTSEASVCIIDWHGNYIVHPDPEMIGHQIEKRLTPALKALETGKSISFESKPEQNSKSAELVFVEPLRDGWGLIVLDQEVEIERMHAFFNRFIAGGAISLVFVAIATGFGVSRLTKPLAELKQGTEQIASGNYEYRIPVINKDEVGSLALAFNKMTEKLGHSIEALRQSERSRERLNSEIKIAHQIQRGLLPSTFPPFPERTEIDLFAVMEPAYEVGGDFYDFMMVRANSVSLVVGDVADKGIPAALFMAITRTLLKANIELLSSPAEVMKKMNQELCRENQSDSFVTLFYGELCLTTGRVTYCSAGHLPPLLLEPSGKVRELDLIGNIPVGIIEEYDFQEGSFLVNQGDTLVIYSDGVTDVIDPFGQRLGVDKLQDTLRGVDPRMPVADLATSVQSAMHKYAAGQLPSDDATLLIVRYNGSGSVKGRS